MTYLNPLQPEPAFAASSNAEELWWTFPAMPVHARMARAWLAGWLENSGPGKDGKAYGALVAFSELVTSCVLRGTGPITVFARLAEHHLLCEITDRSVEMPALLDSTEDRKKYQKLSLVDALTEDWSVRAAPGGGKTLSFTVELDAEL